MPRPLTEQEKCAQCQRLLEKGKEAVISHGIRKVSVDDITKAAGMAKGSFYQHFESKEKYLYALLEKLHRETFTKAKQIIFEGISDKHNLQANARDFLKKLFLLPEMVFFIQNERDIIALFETISNQEIQSFKQMEAELFSGLLRLAGVDTEKVKPGVVHNYVHVMFLTKVSDLMTEEDLPQTLDLLMDSLMAYIFGGAL